MGGLFQINSLTSDYKGYVLYILLLATYQRQIGKSTTSKLVCAYERAYEKELEQEASKREKLGEREKRE